MHAIASYEGLPISDPQSLVDVELPVPELRPRDVLVRVQAVSVNPVDIKRRAALERSDTPMVLGFDAAGIVEAVGPEVTTLEVGDEVWYAGDVTRPGLQRRAAGRRRADRRLPPGLAELRRGGGAAVDVDHRLGGAV